MLQSYFPIYKIAVDLQRLRRTAEVYKDTSRKVEDPDAKSFQFLLKAIQRECLALGLTPTHEMAKRLIEVLKPRRAAEGNPNWLPRNWAEGWVSE
jgi:hypothetical protein